LREHPDKREILYDLYLKEMQNQPIPFIEVRGDRNTRKRTAIEAVEQLFTK
jgi:hypothetical protein